MENLTNNKKISYGTREWATRTINCCTGCAHDCRYCYARSMAVRFNHTTQEEWKNKKIRQKDVDKAYRYNEGTIMFPSSHDITENNFDACFKVLEKLLKAGNRVLIVSKPHLSCIKHLCDKLQLHRDNILFRFTITAKDDKVLAFWEPGAPLYEERKQSLKYAFDKGFETSVSIEPMLDSENNFELVEDLSPYVTNSIWIGKLNQPRRRIDMRGTDVAEAVAKVEAGQTDARIIAIYERLKSNPIVKWKESVKKVMNIDLPDTTGLNQ
jgi:DNA repair photolyase